MRLAKSSLHLALLFHSLGTQTTLLKDTRQEIQAPSRHYLYLQNPLFSFLLKWQYDVKQSIGKRYARMDEAGTPYCFTVDGETAQSQTVTVRERDTGDQSRINIDQVQTFLADKLGT